MLLSLPGTLLTSFSKAWCPFSVFDPSAREPPTQFLGLFFSLGHSPRFLLRKRHEASWSIVKHHISRFAHVVKQRYLDEFWKANVWEAVWVAHDSVYPASATQVPCSCPLGLSSIKMALRMVALQHWARTHHSAAVAIEQLTLFKIASDAEGHSFSPQLHPACLGATAMGRICGIIRYQALVKEWGEGLKVVEVKADFLVCRCSVVVDIPETLWHK